RVTECYVFKIDLALGRNQLDRIWRVFHRRLGIEDRENLGGRAERTLHHDVKLAQRFDRLIDDENSREKSEESAGAEVRRVNVEKRESDADRGNNFNERSNRFGGPDRSHRL